MNTSTTTDARAPPPAPALVYAALADAAAVLALSDWIIAVEPTDVGTRVTLTLDHCDGRSTLYFHAYEIPTSTEAQRTLRAFRALHAPELGDHLALRPVEESNPHAWRGYWYLGGGA